MILYPWLCRYFGMRCDGFDSSVEAPTTAIVFVSA
jgi:hypothetical protein